MGIGLLLVNLHIDAITFELLTPKQKLQAQNLAEYYSCTVDDLSQVQLAEIVKNDLADQVRRAKAEAKRAAALVPDGSRSIPLKSLKCDRAGECIIDAPDLIVRERVGDPIVGWLTEETIRKLERIQEEARRKEQQVLQDAVKQVVKTQPLANRDAAMQEFMSLLYGVRH